MRIIGMIRVFLMLSLWLC